MLGTRALLEQCTIGKIIPNRDKRLADISGVYGGGLGVLTDNEPKLSAKCKCIGLGSRDESDESFWASTVWSRLSPVVFESGVSERVILMHMRRRVQEIQNGQKYLFPRPIGPTSPVGHTSARPRRTVYNLSYHFVVQEADLPQELHGNFLSHLSLRLASRLG